MAAVRLLWKKWRTRCPLLRLMLAEFLGTFVLVVLGEGAVAAASCGSSQGQPNTNPVLSRSMGNGIAVALGVWVSSAVSDGHVNPAFTLCMAITQGFPVLWVPIYWAMQLLGAMVGAILVYGIYLDSIMHSLAVQESSSLTNSPLVLDATTMGSTCIYPNALPVPLRNFQSEVVAMMLMLIVISALMDKNFASSEARSTKTFFVGQSLMVVCTVLGGTGGFTTNPARELGTRLLSACLYGLGVFCGPDNYWWVSIVAPMIGAVAGSLVYILCIGMYCKFVNFKAADLDETAVEKLTC